MNGILKWWNNINAKMIEDMINFVPTPKSILLNVIISLILMDVFMSFLTMFRFGFTSKIVNWWLDRK